MLDQAEIEFFGQQDGDQVDPAAAAGSATAAGSAAATNPTPAESKAALSSQRQTYFKASPLASLSVEAAAAQAYAAAAQSKTTTDRARVGAFKPSRSEGKVGRS